MSNRKYIHLAPFNLNQIPAHPQLKAHQAPSSSPSLRTFITELLTEAIIFSDDFVPSTFKRKGQPKKSGASTAPVQLLAWTDEKGAGAGGSQAEYWFARQSVHEDVRKKGTADWEEFENGLYREHSVHEMEYTPDVYDAHKVLDWNDEIAVLESEGWDDSRYSGVGMEIFEMAHNIPFPLNNRVFPVLIVRALVKQTASSATTNTHHHHHHPHPVSTTTPSQDSFIVAQIPIDLSKVPASLYSSGRHQKDGDAAQKRANVTMGRYVSIERVVKREEEEGRAGQQIYWMMATASDAEGNLPMAMQKLGVPGAVVKDVGLFVEWTAKKRR